MEAMEAAEEIVIGLKQSLVAEMAVVLSLEDEIIV